MWRDIASIGTIGVRRQNVKKAVEMAFTNETNVADLYCRTGLPESVAISGILEAELFTKYIILH